MSDTNGVFEKVDPGVRIYRSRFARRFQKLLDCYPGRLYPILADIMMPGDVVKLGLRWNVKANPSVTPYFTRVRCSVFYFAVPLRMIFGTEYGDKSDTFIEDILTGGKDGNNTDSIPLLTKPEFFQDLGASGSLMYYSNGDGSNPSYDTNGPVGSNQYRTPYLVSLSNCFGYPTMRLDGKTVPGPVKYPPTVTYHRAYWRIVSDYFADEDTEPLLLDFRFKALSSYRTISDQADVNPGYPFNTSWSRDYFMSALKDFLKGTPPALDVGSVTIPQIGPYSFPVMFHPNNDTNDFSPIVVSPPNDVKGVSSTTSQSALFSYSTFPEVTTSVNGSFGVDDMRLAFATQRILERANRCGTRYTEYLMSTFRTAPSDGTLQRPWYLGGVRFNIVTPEVLQTSESATTPQGTRSGAGFSIGQQKLHSYHCKEWSVLMAVLNIEPDATYCDGMPRQARYKSRWDFFNPSMQNLSEQIVEKGEIFSDVANKLSSYNPSSGFGYQGMWNELRTKMDEVSGNFRYSELDNWHMSLRFTAAPALSSVFKKITTYFYDFMRPFAVQNMPPFLCSFYHDNVWIRPMVRHPVPGLIDHN